MTAKFDNHTKNVIIHTGNILNLNEIKKKAGQTLSEEVVECINIVLRDWTAANETPPDHECVEIRGNNSALDVKEDRRDLKFSLKMFLPVKASEDKYAIKKALDAMLLSLNTPHVESLVVSQAGRQAEGIEPEQQLSRLEAVWSQVETEIEEGRVLTAGVCDIDTELFVSLHNKSKAKPSIIQINLATCCVVPPALQTFAKENHVQLLTHSDPLDLLPESTVSEIFGAGWRLSWVIRSQVHVKCRGVLASKGFIICLERE